jgi:hypothetical protein
MTSAASICTSSGRRRVLAVGYAFPPLQSQMTPVAARLTAGLHKLGFDVDVICADPANQRLPLDESLLDYVDTHCRSIRRIRQGTKPLEQLHQRIVRTLSFPDAMAALHRATFGAIMSLELSVYEAVITWSPFHTINPVMVQVMRRRPGLTWIAHFCDPWADNPLEERWPARLWNEWREPQTLRAATFITHTSREAMEKVLAANPSLCRERTRLVRHAYDPDLYPSRPKRRNGKVTLRFIGTLFRDRSPENCFLAIGELLRRRPDFKDVFEVELIGKVERGMLDMPAARALPTGTIRHITPVPYAKSLQLMYDADLLLLIEADTTTSPFVPSKLVDYMGAMTPIVGITPQGECRDILDQLGCATTNPDDVRGIVALLESAIERAFKGGQESWCNTAFRQSFDMTIAAARLVSLIESKAV